MDSLAGFVASIFIFALGGLLGTELYRFLYRPKVNIRYEDVEPLHSTHGTFWSITVINLGRTVATSCEGVIILHDLNPSDLIDVTEASSYEELPDYPDEDTGETIPRPQLLGRDTFRPVKGASVCWAKLGNPDSVDINPGTTETLDVCRLEKSGTRPYLIFPSEKGWRRVRMRVCPRSLSGRILICPSNEFPTEVEFHINRYSSGSYSFTAHRPSLHTRLRRRVSKLSIYDP